jgi:hypothetical protein
MGCRSCNILALPEYIHCSGDVSGPGDHPDYASLA